MANPKGVKRDFETLERQGESEAEVARQVGVHRQSVNRWARLLKLAGRRGLSRAGRKPRLSEADLRRVENDLERGPLALGYETNLRMVVGAFELTCVSSPARSPTTRISPGDGRA